MVDVASTLMGGSFWAAIMAFFAIFFVIFIAIYVYSALALMTIARKTKTENAWLAWIPIANFYLLTQIAGVNGLWTLAILAGFIPAVGGLFMLGVSIWLFWRVCEKRNFPGWLSLLLLIPIVNLVIIGIIAWAK